MLNSSLESHSSDEFDEECKEIIRKELERLGVKSENGIVHLTFDLLVDTCKYFYKYGDFIVEYYKHPEINEDE